MNNPVSSDIVRLQEILKLTEIAQNQRSNRIEPDLLYLSMIKEYFNSSGIEAIIVDPEFPQRMVKKELGMDGNWKMFNQINIDQGLLWESYKTNQILNYDSTSLNLLDPIDTIEVIPTNQLIICPVTSHSISFGSVGLINPSTEKYQLQDISLLTLFVSKLADHLYFQKLLNEKKSTGDELQISKLQLLKSRNTLRTLFDNIPEGFYIVDREYRLLAVNQARANCTEKPPKDLVGRICFNSLFGLSEPCADCLVQKSISTANSTRRMEERKSGTNQSIQLEISTYPILESDGQAFQVIVLEQDVTEKNKMESETVQGEKMAVIGQLAAGIVHEINNPLTTVLANAQMLLQDISPDQVEIIQSVKLIEMASLRANQVVKNMLSLVGKEKYQIVSIDLNESIQNALMLVSHEFISRKISVRFERGAPMPLLQGSADHLQGAWVNLLINSIEAIDSENGDIKITTKYEGEKFYVEILDNGAGISEQNLDKIFEPFFSTKKSNQTIGLGLSLVRKIIQDHGGQITVESSPGEGSRFLVTLPAHYKINTERITHQYNGIF